MSLDKTKFSNSPPTGSSVYSIIGRTLKINLMTLKKDETIAKFRANLEELLDCYNLLAREVERLRKVAAPEDASVNMLTAEAKRLRRAAAPEVFDVDDGNTSQDPSLSKRKRPDDALKALLDKDKSHVEGHAKVKKEKATDNFIIHLHFETPTPYTPYTARA